MHAGTFASSILDENSRAILERRQDVGRKALDLIGEDEETDARDIIADILTAVCGPSGTWSYTEGDTRYESRSRLAAINAARELLDAALRSWEGDSEDYIEGADELPCYCGEQACPRCGLA